MTSVTQAQPEAGAPGKTNGKPQDAFDEFLRAVRTPVEPGRADRAVAIAFAAGWHAADALSAAAAAEAGDEAAQKTLTLAGTMLRADVAKLGDPLRTAAQDIDGLMDAIAGLDVAGTRVAAAARVDEVFGAQLMAADFRLGKAFVLGCRIAGLRDAAPADGFDPHAFAARFVADHDRLQDSLSQLATALPPNAGHSVRDSLNMWATALTADAEALKALRPDHVMRQVEAWRTLLSGEKAGRDTLELPDYVGVAEGVAEQIRQVIRRGLRRFWPLLAAATLLLLAGIALIVLLRDSAGVTAGIAAVITSLGLTWKGLGGSLGRAVAKVEQPAWAAQVDRAIAFAITRPLPAELVENADKGTLLGTLHAWRKDHARPSDQGTRMHAGPPEADPAAS
jgi:hypothetical protein